MIYRTLLAGGQGAFRPPVTVFYSPHQDDETVFMGLAIANRVLAGDIVHAVLMTTGENSAVYELLTGSGGVCPWHGVTHSFTMTRGEFSSYRDAEQSAALQALGLDTSHIHIAPSRPEDGDLNATFFRSILDTYEASFTGATHRTMSWHDSHVDHIACGEGLRDAYDDSDVTSVKFQIRSELEATYDGTYEAEPAAAVAAVTNALNEYKVYIPASNRYGIGYHSIASIIDDQLSNPHNETHEQDQNRP